MSASELNKHVQAMKMALEASHYHKGFYFGLKWGFLMGMLTYFVITNL